MEFSNQYLAYEEYIELGGTIDLVPFNLLEFEARKKIDLRTQNRLKNIDINEIPEEVKICEFRMIESMSNADDKIEKMKQNVIKSENIDGYSVSYLSGNEVKDVLELQEKELQDIMLESLYGVIVNGEHILFLGVD